MSCGHNHKGDHLGGFICDANQYVHGSTGMESAVVVGAPNRTVSAMTANMTGGVLIARTILSESLKIGRSKDCPACAEAFDRATQALAILEKAPVSC